MTYPGRKFNSRYRPGTHLPEPKRHYVTIRFTVCLETVAVILLVVLAVLVTIVMLSPL